MTLIKELPELERPREKLRMLGAGRLSNSELLAILLGTGTKDTPATALADRILSMCGSSLAWLSDCSPEELSKLQGIGMAKSCQIVAAAELGRRIASSPKTRRARMGEPEDIAELFLEDMRYLKNERFKALLMNIKSEMLAIEDISSGNINTSLVDAREVFRPAIRRGAAFVALIHNHPSGNPTPSGADIEITGQLVEAGELLGIRVVDHIIVGDGTYVSMKRDGFM
ncbi:MAG: DNA repair protein RadC [Clostridiales Family XIII bacterium]|jgi:DNA repair protein RadC|nr:DNA repair protein RadC [Clostridiales Family XIII bacterium]